MALSARVSSWRKVPILFLGYDIRRWEHPGGGEVYLPKLAKKLVYWTKLPSLGPTHLQYHSPFGFLLTWPLCFHIWYQFKEQQGKPGSEIVFYFRIGARWDALDEIYVTPSLYLGGHWD